MPWPVVSRQAPRLRHVYAQRADVTVQVQLGMLNATLRIALVGKPLVFRRWTAAHDAAATTGCG